MPHPQSLDQFVKKNLKGTIDSKIKEEIDKKVSDKYMTLHKSKSKKEAHKPKKSKSKLMTSRKRKELKLFEPPKECEKYELYLPLHTLWKEYISDLIESQSNIESLMLRADYHGALIKVIQSKAPQMVGIEGIIIQETKNTFKVITQQDKYKGIVGLFFSYFICYNSFLTIILKVIPKANNIFSFVIGENLVIIYGNNIRCKATERSVKKFKKKESIDL